MYQRCTRALSAITILVFFPYVAHSQLAHPKKQMFSDVAKWPTTSPGKSTKLKNFRPFRAVYDRTYKQSSGPNAGAARQDRVIISAEETAWEGKRTVAITLIDSGIVKHRDTNARVSTTFVDQDNLRLLFGIAPVPGKAKDYYIGRVDPNIIKVSQVTTGTQTLTPKTLRTNQPGFGPAAWAMASMKLRKGLKIKLGPVVGGRDPLSMVTFGHVIGKGKFVDGSGNETQAWIVESSSSMVTQMVRRVYLIDKPPYYLGTESVDLDSGKRKKFVWLRNVEVFKKK